MQSSLFYISMKKSLNLRDHINADRDASLMRELIEKVLVLARLNQGSPLTNLKILNFKNIISDVIKVIGI